MDQARQQLQDDGFCVIEGVLDADTLDDIKRISTEALEGASAEHRSQNRSQGSLINIADYPGYAALIGHPGARKAMEQLAFSDPRFSSGYLISKPPAGPPLFWHQDWWGWDDPVSYTDEIAQVFFMYYLTDTSPENGCLRVLPGTHRQKHVLHDADQAHGEGLSRVDDPDHHLYRDVAGEVPVPVRAGDLVIGDARLLHSAYANRSDEERSLITLWHHPNFSGLPAGMRARIREVFDRRDVDTDPNGAAAMTLDDWPDRAKAMVVDLLPPFEPGLKPHAWNRSPNWQQAGRPKM